MAIIKQYHKNTDTTYVYESVSYWDAEKGQSRSKRTLIGKLDPETGEVIPTGKRGRAKNEAKAHEEEVSTIQEYANKLNRAETEVSQLRLQLAELTRTNQQLSATLKRLQGHIQKMQEEFK